MVDLRSERRIVITVEMVSVKVLLVFLWIIVDLQSERRIGNIILYTAKVPLALLQRVVDLRSRRLMVIIVEMVSYKLLDFVVIYS